MKLIYFWSIMLNTLRTSFISGVSTNRQPLLSSVPSQSPMQQKKKIPPKVIETVSDKSYPSAKSI